MVVVVVAVVKEIVLWLFFLRDFVTVPIYISSTISTDGIFSESITGGITMSGGTTTSSLIETTFRFAGKEGFGS